MATAFIVCHEKGSVSSVYQVRTHYVSYKQMEFTTGNIIAFEPVAQLHQPDGLRRAESNYGVQNLEFHPKTNDLYAICRDGSIHCLSDPERPIGWELGVDEENDIAWTRISQVGFFPVEVRARHMGQLPENMIPDRARTYGSQVFVCRRTSEGSTCGRIVEAADEGVEVSS
jgi:hypothetical protein